MISMYSDAAIGRPFDPASNVRPLHLRSENPTRRSDRTKSERARGLHSKSTQWVDPPSGDTLHDDSLNAARGMALSIVLGLGCWLVIGGVVRIAFF